jgi:hypothetical protein
MELPPVIVQNSWELIHKCCEKVSLQSHIKEHFQFLGDRFSGCKLCIHIWRPSRTPSCVMRQARKLHQQIIQFNYLLLGWRTAAVKNAYFFGMPYKSSKLCTVTMSVSVIYFRHLKVPVTFGAWFYGAQCVMGWNFARMDGWFKSTFLFCVCFALGIAEVLGWPYPQFKESWYMSIRC